MQNVNPLTLYVPILQTASAQETAQNMYQYFNNPTTKANLDAMAIVHYARIALVPNTNAAGILGVLVITEFDGNMNSYLQAFWDEPGGGVKTAFITLATIALNPPAGFNPDDPSTITYTIFSNFILANNLSEPADLYYAYPQSVEQITEAFPPNS
ncbi:MULTISPECIES: hypothetical protein [Mucilaginibacter]|uniref:hypothetical protein n=1 Tax=Mucilaginibacter TaxID=423349 RepID=UPI0020938057|nr:MULTISPECIES: hypothetical protein [Mucilaginibacter]MCO5946838.1 hypothetical protein [Mucilaginibacter flavidus]